MPDKAVEYTLSALQTRLAHSVRRWPDGQIVVHGRLENLSPASGAEDTDDGMPDVGASDDALQFEVVDGVHRLWCQVDPSDGEAAGLWPGALLSVRGMPRFSSHSSRFFLQVAGWRVLEPAVEPAADRPSPAVLRFRAIMAEAVARSQTGPVAEPELPAWMEDGQPVRRAAATGPARQPRPDGAPAAPLEIQRPRVELMTDLARAMDSEEEVELDPTRLAAAAVARPPASGAASTMARLITMLAPRDLTDAFILSLLTLALVVAALAIVMRFWL